MKRFRIGYFLEVEAEGVDSSDAIRRAESALMDGRVGVDTTVEAPPGVRTIARIRRPPIALVSYERPYDDNFVGYLNTVEGINRFPEGRIPGKTSPRCPECRMIDFHLVDCSQHHG